ncbi:MAG TPA: hypothetical protein VME18_05980 [Acidobacteriaceae bacterium]|nr:hypothetical protein [Acidobacteriaceae bacterium]
MSSNQASGVLPARDWSSVSSRPFKPFRSAGGAGTEAAPTDLRFLNLLDLAGPGVLELGLARHILLILKQLKFSEVFASADAAPLVAIQGAGSDIVASIFVVLKFLHNCVANVGMHDPLKAEEDRREQEAAEVRDSQNAGAASVDGAHRQRAQQYQR